MLLVAGSVQAMEASEPSSSLLLDSSAFGLAGPDCRFQLGCDVGHVRSWFDDCPSSLALLFDVLAVSSRAPGTA